jgi:hypothetical protein
VRAYRAQICRPAADGFESCEGEIPDRNSGISGDTYQQCNPAYVKRYNAAGLDSLLRDKTRKPGTPPVSEEIKNKVIDIACHEKPEDATHWSTRRLAKRVGISHNKVSEILRASNIKPQIQSYYSYSNDPDFETKLRDVAGLYMNPPDNAIVLCVDEKTQK